MIVTTVMTVTTAQMTTPHLLALPGNVRSPEPASELTGTASSTVADGRASHGLVSTASTAVWAGRRKETEVLAGILDLCTTAETAERSTEATAEPPSGTLSLQDLHRNQLISYNFILIKTHSPPNAYSHFF